MNTRTMLTLIAFGGMLALVACSSDDAGPYDSSDGYCTARAAAECNGLAKKCGASSDACNKERVSICTSANTTALAQGLTYHSDQVQACIDSINDTYKDNAADTTPDEEATTTAVCARIYTGTKQANETCTTTSDCQGSSLICDRGVCATQTSVALKAPCNNPGDVCVTDSYCQVESGTQVSFCVAKNALGDICSADAPCIESLRCINTCVARVGAGQSCSSDGDCDINAPYCDTTTKKCRPKYESTSPACQDYGL